jgi:methylated-DNA-protein-cysteine methyltransferase related protein
MVNSTPSEYRIQSSIYKSIYNIVSQIPSGRVATYGQIAKLAGIPGQARQVGYALSAINDNKIPWHRVVNAKGKISPRSDSAFEKIQRVLLEHEGVQFNEQGVISLEMYRWQAKLIL